MHRKHETRTLWLTGTLHAFTHLYQVALMPLYLLIQKDFGFQSVTRSTLLLTVLMAAYALPSYPIGVLADRFNRKKLLAFGLALNGLAFVGMAKAPDYGWMLVAAVVAGIGGSFYHPAATAMLARLFPRNTGKALGLAGIGSGVGFFIGPIFTGWRAAMLEPRLGAAAWRQPILELGLAGIAGAALFVLLADNERSSTGLQPGSFESSADALPASQAPDKPLPHGAIFPTPALWLLFTAYCLAFSLRDFTGASMGTLGSLFLQKVHGFGPRWTGIALSGIYLAAVISNPLFGRLSDGGRKRWVTLALVVATAMVAVFPHVPTRWTIPVFVVYGFFFMASYPMTEAALMESVPDSVRGRVFGLFMMICGVIGNLSHWWIGEKVKHLGTAAESASSYFSLYAFLALLLLCSLAGLFCLGPLRKREGLELSPALGSAPAPGATVGALANRLGAQTPGGIIRAPSQPAAARVVAREAGALPNRNHLDKP